MYGGTAPATRRLVQLAFNRPNSFPRVLVAQSMVGREGLNLHRACRIVVPVLERLREWGNADMLREFRI